MNKDKNKNLKQRKIGITGGIACGKSTIANYISKRKEINILDADRFTKLFLEPESNSYKEIISHFGSNIILHSSPKKEIDTAALKKIIFSQDKERIWVENLLHPLIKEKMKYECEKLKHKRILILLIPLLFEAQFNDLCSEIWLIKCSRDNQKKRLMKRDNLDEKEADKIINIQNNLIEKEKISDVILNTDGPQFKWKRLINNLI
tara:strand:+ start:1632 stop:2246 length:615 start_codon:yes stop_codon:yes gene_type:complete